MGTEKTNPRLKQAQDFVNLKRKAAKAAAQNIEFGGEGGEISKDKWKPAPSYNKGVMDRFGDLEITPRQEQKVVPYGGVKPNHSPQLSTESSNNTEVEGLIAPFSPPVTKQDIIGNYYNHGLADVEFAVATSALKAQVRKDEESARLARLATGDHISSGYLADEFDLNVTHVQAKTSDSIRGGNPDTPRNNKFKAMNPKAPATSNGVDQNRVSYKDLNFLFQNKFLTNKLYFNESDDAGFNLVAYNITLFCLPANITLGHRINEVAMKGFNAYKDNAIIITQSAGTDEFYIEGLSFTTTIGKNPNQGTGTQPLDIQLTIKAPTNNDLIDLLIKAAIVGGWKDHTDMPLFIHVEWNGRDSVTDAPVKQINNIFRCFPCKIAKAGAATIDEGGSTYELTLVSYRAEAFNNQKQTTKENIIVSGYTVGEILAQITTEMYKLETNGKDLHMIPDEIYIEFPEKNGGGVNKIKDYKMVQGTGKHFGNVAGQREEAPDKASGKAVHVENPSPPGTRNVSSAQYISDSQAKAKAKHTANLNKSLEKITFHSVAGTPITEIIIKLVSNTVEAQAMISGIKKPDGVDAQKEVKKINPDSVIREFLQIESDIILKDYDPGRRKYASKTFFKVFEHEAPSFSETQQATTTQTKAASLSRIQEMLTMNFIRKCYHHMYTGLNTEIKGLEWTFDNLVFQANQLYSGIVSGYQQRQHGVQVGDAKQGAAHLGFADKALGKLRVLDEVKKESAAAVKKAETEFESAKKLVGGPPGTAAQTGKLAAEAEAKMKAEQKRHDDKVIDIKHQEIIRTLQGSGAKVSDKVKIIDTKDMSTEQIQNLRKGLHPNQQAFQKGAGPIKIITWEPASLPVAIGKTTYLNDVNDELVNSAIDQGVMFPVKFASSVLSKSESSGLRESHDRGKNIFSEVYQSKDSQMINITLTIRGDPYWWPKIYQGAQLDELGRDISVTPSIQENYCIIIADQSNTYTPATGVMEIQQRNSLNGVYLVISAVHNFSDGEYTQELKLSRGVSIDLNVVFGGMNLADAARANRAERNTADEFAKNMGGSLDF